MRIFKDSKEVSGTLPRGGEGSNGKLDSEAE